MHTYLIKIQDMGYFIFLDRHADERDIEVIKSEVVDALGVKSGDDSDFHEDFNVEVTKLTHVANNALFELNVKTEISLS